MKMKRNKNQIISMVMMVALIFQLILVPTNGFATSSRSDEELEKNTIQNKKRITNGLEGRYYLSTEPSELVMVRMEDNDAQYDLSKLDIPQTLEEQLKQVEFVIWQGYVKADESGDYTFTTSDNEHTKLWVDDTLMISGISEESKKISLKEKEKYKIYIEHNNTGELPKLNIMWQNDDNEQEVIPQENLLFSVHDGSEKRMKPSSSVSKSDSSITVLDVVYEAKESDSLSASFMTTTSDTNVDTDSDGVYDTWEMNGYTYLPDLGLVEWDDAYETSYSVGKYITSPTDWSTDQDPYSDLEEVSGQIDAAISGPADHPLIPAFPDIKANIEGIQVTPNGTITLTDGTTETTGWSDTTADTSGTVTAAGWKVGGEVSAEFSTKGISKTVKFYGESNGHVDMHDTTVKTGSDSGHDTTMWSGATSTNPSQAATVILNVTYDNNGTAPAYDIIPTLSLGIGNTTAFTVEPPNDYEIQSISPDETYPASGTVALQYIESGAVDNIPIYLTLDQVKLIEMGYNISLETNQIDAKVKRMNNDGSISVEYDWSWYKGAIEATTADITFLSNTTGEHNFKVYANDHTKTNYEYKPEVTIGEALEAALETQIINDELYIYGEKVDETWRMYFSSDSEVDSSAFENATNIFDIELRPGMKIIIEKPDPNGTPYVQYAFYDESGKQLVASILENGSSVSSVEATVKTTMGAVETLTMVDIDENDEYDGIYTLGSSLSIPLDLTYSGAEITVTAANGQSTTSYILKPYDMDIMGLGYIHVGQQAIANISSLTSQYPSAEAFVVEVLSNYNATRDHTVNIGSQSAVLGVTNAPVEYRGAAATYQLYSKTNYDGTRTDLNSTWTNIASGFMDNGLSSLKVQNSASGAGIVLYDDYLSDNVIYQGGDYQTYTSSIADIGDDNFNDTATSARIVGQSGKPYLRLFDGTNYQGNYVDIYENESNLSQFDFNDKASSYSLINASYADFHTTLYKDSGYSGASLAAYQKNLADFGEYDRDNMFSSVKFENVNAPKFTLYEDTNYGGDSYEVTQFNNDIENNLGDISIGDQRVSSIKVENNSDRLAKLILYMETNFGGDYVVIDQDVPNLSAFLDTISLSSGSSSLLNYNDEISSYRFYYGPIYRFYEDADYQGNYADYIIGATSIGTFDDNFESLQVFNPHPEIGLTVYEDNNYQGDFLNFVGSTTSLSGLNNKISSVKLVAGIPYYRPSHNTTMVIPMSDLTKSTSGEYFGSGTSMNLIGYFERSEDAGKFTELNLEQEYTYASDGSYSFETGINSATGYLVQVESLRASSDSITVTLNDTAVSELGTSDSSALGFAAGALYSPVHSNLVFVPANESSPSTVSVDISVGGWIDDASDSYTIKVLGYFADESSSSSDWYYETFNTPITVVSPSTADDVVTYATLEPLEFNETPKAYLINVAAKGIGSDHLKFNINSNYIQLGTSATSNANGENCTTVEHSGLMYVSADSSDAYKLTMMPEIGSWFSKGGGNSIEVEIVGYFYE